MAALFQGLLMPLYSILLESHPLKFSRVSLALKLVFYQS